MVRLNKRQRAVAKDFFRSGQGVEEVAHRHRISAEKLRQWLADPVFLEYLRMLSREELLQSRCLLARYSAVAAARLIALTESDKEETRRRACLDILAAVAQEHKAEAASEEDEPRMASLEPAQAEALLEALAAGRGEEGDS